MHTYTTQSQDSPSRGAVIGHTNVGSHAQSQARIFRRERTTMNVAGVSTTPQDHFSAHKTDTETHHGRPGFTGKNYRMHNITTTYIKIHSVMRTMKPQNVMYRSTKPGHNHIQYKIMQWHDRRRPHASQWPKPTYHHSPLMESVRPEHEPIPKPELSIS